MQTTKVILQSKFLGNGRNGRTSRVRQRTLFKYETQMSKLKNEVQRLISDIEDDEKELHLTKIKEVLHAEMDTYYRSFKADPPSIRGFLGG